MIFCKKDDLALYKGISATLDDAIITVLAQNAEEYSLGRKDISENVYINCMEYETCDNTDQLFETHERYGDIHISLQGTEVIHIADVKKQEIVEVDRENDYVGTKGTWASCVCLTPEDALVVFPGEAHRLKGSLEKSEIIKKEVVKFNVK